MKKEKIVDAISILIIVFILGTIAYTHTLHPFRIILTGSMKPAINPGDVVVVKKVDNPDTLTVGDIVMYTRPGYKEPIVHRIVSITTFDGQKCFIIKGDDNKEPDPPYPGKNGDIYPCVPEYAIEGKVIFVIRDVGKPIVWLFSH